MWWQVIVGATLVSLLGLALPLFVHRLLPLQTTRGRGPNVTTFFFPGHGADASQLARYVGPEGMELDGYRVAHPNSAKLVHAPYVAVQPYGVQQVADPSVWQLAKRTAIA